MKNYGLPLDKKNIVKQTLSILFDQNQVVEVRALANNATYSGYFNNMDKIVTDVYKLDSVPLIKGIYIVLNEIDPSLHARRANRLPKLGRSDSTTSDANIIRRRWLPIDIDPKRPSGISSSDEEHDRALQKADKIAAGLSEFGFPSPIKADSGNGAHLLYRVDLENSDETRNLIQNCLEVLSIIHSDESCDVDTSVFNAARIWKLYGTISRKGDNVSDRPHRRARLLYVPENIEIVSQKQLENLSGFLPKSLQVEQKQTFSSTAQGPSSSERKIDLGVWLEEHDIKVYNKKTWMDGILYNLDQCPFSDEHRSGSYAVQFPNGKIKVACFHNSCGSGKQRWGELWKKYESNSQPTSNQKYDHVESLPVKEEHNIKLTNTAFHTAQVQKTNYKKTVQSEEFNIDDSVSTGILRCVALLENPSFGKTHIINILIGQKVGKIEKYRHNDLDVFGILNEYSYNNLNNELENLISTNYLKKAAGRYKTIHLTQKGFEYLQSNDYGINLVQENDTEEIDDNTTPDILTLKNQYTENDNSVIQNYIKKLDSAYESDRAFAAEMLGKIGDVQAVFPLINVSNDQNYAVRAAVATALGQLKDPSAFTPLIQLLRDKSYLVRSNALKALYDLNDRRACKPIIRLLKDPSPNIRADAAFVLGSIGDAGVVPSLLAVLEQKGYDNVKVDALISLGKIGGVDVFESILNALKSSNPSVIEAAAESLGYLQDYRAFNYLKDMTIHSSANVRRGAIRGLGFLGNKNAIDIIIPAFKDEIHVVRISAVEALGELGGIKSIYPLIEALNDEFSDVQCAAAKALGQLGYKQALDPLHRLRNDSNFDVQDCAKRAIATIERKP